MGIGKAFDVLGDWVSSGSDLASFSKIIGVSVLGVGVLLSPFVYVANKNSDELDALIKEIDRVRPALFSTAWQNASRMDTARRPVKNPAKTP